jgi:hypothetical protein
MPNVGNGKLDYSMALKAIYLEPRHFVCISLPLLGFEYTISSLPGEHI